MGGASSQSVLCYHDSVQHDLILTWAKETLWLRSILIVWWICLLTLFTNMGINFGYPRRASLPSGWSRCTHSLTYLVLETWWRKKIRYETTRNVRFERSHVKSVNLIISGWEKQHRRRLTWRRTLLVTTTPVRELKVGCRFNYAAVTTGDVKWRDRVVSIAGWSMAAEVFIGCWENDCCWVLE